MTTRDAQATGGALLPQKIYHRNFAHELMVAEITAFIELGTKEHLTFVSSPGKKSWQQSIRPNQRASPLLPPRFW